MGYDNGNSSAGEAQVFVIGVQRKEDENRLTQYSTASNPTAK
jgi:hypothetical protein